MYFCPKDSKRCVYLQNYIKKCFRPNSKQNNLPQNKAINLIISLLLLSNFVGLAVYNPVMRSASHISASVPKAECFKEQRETTAGPGPYQVCQHSHY